jgi:hypothetical protein
VEFELHDSYVYVASYENLVEHHDPVEAEQIQEGERYGTINREEQKAFLCFIVFNDDFKVGHKHDDATDP